MEKLRLNLDRLTVESFEAGKDDSLKGTVDGYQDTCSCGYTCGAASRGQESYEKAPPTRYACCV